MADDIDKDPPIAEVGYTAGVTVIDFGDIRVARGLSRRPAYNCQHHKLVYDRNERRIWCQDCEKTVDPFDAFVGMTENFQYAYDKLRRRQEELDSLEAFQIRTLAGKALEKAWRKRDRMPACPYCNNGLFPEDFKNGVSLISVDYATARRAKWLADKEKPKT